MNIVSKFKDYYDSVQFYGQDQNIHYIRNTEQVTIQYRTETDNDLYKLLNPLTKFPDSCHITNPETKESFHLYPFTVFFCGRTYNGMCYDKLVEGKLVKVAFYDLETYKKFVTENSTPDKLRYRWHRYLNSYTRKEFLEQNKGYNRNLEYLIKNKIVSALVYPSGTCVYNYVLNPCLKEFEFYKVFDSYYAYQEIDMYISGVIGGPAGEMPPMTDLEKVASHGMDKWSFRKIGKNSKL